MSSKLRLRGFVLVGLILTIFAIVFSVKIHSDTFDSLNKDFIYNSNLIHDALDYSDISALQGSRDDIGTYMYERIKNQLRASLKIDDNFRFVYIVGINDEEQVFFYADSEHEGSSLESPAGQIYYEADQEFKNSFEDGKIRITKPYEDRWGKWVTAILPIKSPIDGEIKYALCIDKSRNDWYFALFRNVSILLITYIVVIGILVYLYFRNNLVYVEMIGVISVGLVLSMFFAWYSHEYSEMKNKELFKQMSDERTVLITDSIYEIKYIELPSLNGFLSNFEVSESKYKSFSKFLTNINYVQAWEWIPIVKHGDLKSFEDKASNTYNDYQVWEKDGENRIPVRAREVYYPVLFITPLEENRAIIGYDLGSEESTKSGIEEAYANKTEVASDPFTLIQSDGEQKSILVYTPVMDHKTGTVEGFGAAVIKLHDMVNNTYKTWYSDELYPLSIEIYSYNDDETLAFLETTYGDSMDVYHWDSKYHVRKPIFIFGKIYFLLSHESEQFVELYPVRGWVTTLFIGFLVTLAFSGSAYVIKNSQIELHNKLRERTKQLQAADDEFIERIYKSQDSTLVIQENDYKFMLYNEAFLRMFGFNKGEYIDDLTPADISPLLQPGGQPSIEKAQSMIETAFEQGFNRFDWQHKRKDGSLFPSDITLTATVYQGNPILVCLIRDISEEKENEKAFNDLMYRFSIAVDSAEIGIWDLDLLTDKLKWDRWMFKIYGVSEDTFKETNEEWEKRIHTEDYFETIRKFEACLAGEDDYDTEFRIIRPDGEIRYVKSNGKTINDYSGNAIRIIGVNIDITDRRQIEEDLKNTNLILEEETRKAEMANVIKSQFLANMSHEIRTPMNGVIGMTSLLSDTSLTAEQRQYVDVIRSSGQSLLDLINDILDFSKIEADKLQIENIDFNLRQVVDELTDMIAIKTDEKGIELLQFIDTKIPDYLNGDPGRIRQILINLVSNAVKFTDKGSVLINLLIKDSGESNLTIRFEVIDNGIGIAEDKISLLFNEFEQIDPSNTRKYGGTGLGLAICKKLSKLMGGTIGVESKVNEGSKFWFEIPFGYSSNQSSNNLNGNEFRNIDVYLYNIDEADNNILTSTFDRLNIHHFDIDNDLNSIYELLDILKTKKNLSILIAGFKNISTDTERIALRYKAIGNDNIRLVGLVSTKLESEFKERYYDYTDRIISTPIRQSELYDMLVDWSNGIVVNKTADVEHIVRGKDEIIRNTNMGLHLLLAEDNITNQKVAVGILQKLGYKVDVVANGAEAIESLKVIPYDLVLMDVQMPELDGYEATRLIREGNSGVLDEEIVIIAMTANAMKGDMEKCLEAGMNDYIPKPIEPITMSKVLHKWLKSKSNENSIVFDKEGMLKRMMNDFELAWVTVEAFEEDFPRQFDLINGYIVSKDYEKLLRTVHGLKGAALNVGGMELSEVAAAYESELREDKYSNIEKYTEDIHLKANKLLNQIYVFKESIKDKI